MSDLENNQNSDQFFGAYGVDRSVFFELFPFHIVFDRAMVICNIGDSLAKVFPELIGQQLDEMFKLVRPALEFTMSNVCFYSEYYTHTATIL